MFVVIALSFLFKKSYLNTQCYKYKKWALTELQSHLSAKKCRCKNCHKYGQRLSQDFWNWRKYLTIVFKLLVSLWTETWYKFVTFNTWVAQEHYCHFEICIKCHMLNRQHLITKSNLSKHIAKNSYKCTCYPLYFRLVWNYNTWASPQ